MLELQDYDRKRTIKIVFSIWIFLSIAERNLDIADYVELHITEKSNNETTTETLRWVHIALSNAKRNFIGNYHKIKGK